MSDDTETEIDADAELETDAQPEPEVGRYGCPETEALGERAIHPSRDQWVDTAQALLDDGWSMCVDLTAVDYLTYSARRNLPDGVASERFEVVAAFISHTTGQRLRAKVQVPANDTTIASLVSTYPGVDYLEREVFDMFGITFEGHPDLSRILMPETWEGHPLRKDYAVGGIPVQFKGPQGG